MTNTRDDLIADWHNRLADAEDADAESSQRAAWLARLRVRLYRFLLSLYGDGHWNAPPPPELLDTAGNSAILDGPDVLPLAGKPAKDRAKIRSVLETVASAQSSKPAGGPWVDCQWVVVARRANELDLEACVRLLQAQGVVCRWLPDQRLVLVPAALATLAHKRIVANLSRLRLRPPELAALNVKVAAASSRATIIIATAPCIAIATMAFVSYAYSDAWQDYPAWLPVAHGLGIFAALFALLFLVRPIGQLVQAIDRGLSRACAALRKPRRSKGPQP